MRIAELIRSTTFTNSTSRHFIELKFCVAAHSRDDVEWSNRHVGFDGRRNVPTEDIGVVGLNVWNPKNGYRGIYTGLGTKFKTYARAAEQPVLARRWLQYSITIILPAGKNDALDSFMPRGAQINRELTGWTALPFRTSELEK
ncbi:MAG: hypothetical protein ACKV19_29145 [Verrucomicrobiales bacterium]